MKVSHAKHDYLKLKKDPLEKYLCVFALEVVIGYDLSIASHLDRCNYKKQIQ